ncbi:MAG TPA: MauE/DoxX family redox-associated membrane protein [Verrucomicrobiae bacterium]|nr:MauE/DoxX family redox-associated membrane protein [Verrucomicrobiae bacterium]
MKAVALLLRLALGGAFIIAGALKFLQPATFAADIGNYRLLPHEAINLLAITLPWIEVVAGVLLALGVWRRASAGVIAVMLMVFLIAIGQALARGLDVRCGCFGTVEARRVSVLALGQDTALLAVAAWLVWREKN